jgi:hypothetical protein
VFARARRYARVRRCKARADLTGSSSGAIGFRSGECPCADAEPGEFLDDSLAVARPISGGVRMKSPSFGFAGGLVPAVSFVLVLTGHVRFGAIGQETIGPFDRERAAQFFREATALCEREGGRLWGLSLCGPMVFGDPITKAIATSQPAPEAPPPASLGFANAAMKWGDSRWATFAWPLTPTDARLRAKLMIHELFHRVQPELGLLIAESAENPHLDTVEGRYWIRLEWRGLARALSAQGELRRAALSDALAFRRARHAAFPGSSESEHVLDVNEGLAQYTGTVVAAGSDADAVTDAIGQLAQAERNETFVRTFPYASGVAYGLLLDAWSPGWPRQFKSVDDLGQLAAKAAGARPTQDVDAAARTYGGPELKVAETDRHETRARRIADLRRRFVDGPVLVLPGSRNSSFVTSGMTPIPGEGTIYPSFRSTAEWGTLAADEALQRPDRSSIRVPGPATVQGRLVTGRGWTLQLAPGWTVRPGDRPGDFVVTREP